MASHWCHLARSCSGPGARRLDEGTVRKVESAPAYRSHLLGACVGRSIFGLQVNPRGENTMHFLVSKGWRQCAASIAIGVVVAWAAPALAQKTELLDYTALETDQIKAYEGAFYKTAPDVTIKWVRESTVIITAKVRADKAHPPP